MKVALLILGVLALILAACTTSMEQASTDYVSNITCGSQSGELGFTIANTGNTTLSLQGEKPDTTHLSIELNGVDLTGLSNYCGRPTMAPKEVARCRRPGKSQTDAGATIKTGRDFLFIKESNAVRVTVGGTTQEVYLVCK